MNYERVLADLLRAPDPGRALSQAREDPALSDELRTMLAAVDPDGLRMTALLVARHRFERLMQGSREAAHWFATDPAALSRLFRRYHREVEPRAQFPSGEAEQFHAWLAGASLAGRVYS